MRLARARSWYARTNWGIAVLSYADNAALMKDPRLKQGSSRWPDHHGVVSGPYVEWWQRTLIVLEGMDHHRIRRLVNPAFSRRQIEPLYPAFASIAEELAQAFTVSGEAEFVMDFAAPYSTRVLCLMLGLPEEEWARLYRLSSVIGLGIGVEVRDSISEIDAATRELTLFAEELVATRRSDPGQDVVSTLVGIRDEDDGRLSDDELVNLVILLVFAGIDTTRNQLTLAIDSFSREPAQWEKLGSDPDRYAMRAVEEVLRVNPIARWVTREAAEDLVHNGLLIERGTTVHMFTLSSGTDPAEYSDPDAIDLDAERSPHFAFGGGVHHCLGHFVARADLDVALSVLSRKIKDISPAPGAEWLPDSGNTGAERFPITFAARA
ncbi:cytochrome P450 [Clavibacter michiganensis]|nr:cytochrome P450 [Clavibacter michiganensis]